MTERDCSVKLWLVCVFSRGFWCCYLYFSKLKKLVSDVQESYGWNISLVSSGTFKFTVKQVIYNVLFGVVFICPFICSIHNGFENIETKVLQWTVVILQATLQWGKKDEPVYVTEESGVVGLNFHQSKEVLIQDNANGHYDVSN